MNFIKKSSLILLFAASFAACEKETEHITDCEEFGVERTENSCRSYTFTSNVSNVDPNPDWYVYTHPNPTPVHYGNDSSAFDFNPTAAGNYTVEAVYKSDLCDEPVTVGFDVDVDEECFKDVDVDCESFGVEMTQHECDHYTFTTNSVNATTGMYVNGELVKSGKKAYDWDPKKSGDYEIKIVYEGEGCPNGTSRIFDIKVDEECFKDEEKVDCEGIDLHVEKNNCKDYTLKASLQSAYWIVNGINQGVDSNEFSFQPTTHGDYTIVVGYENPNCPSDVTKETKIEVDAPCFE